MEVEEAEDEEERGVAFISHHMDLARGLHMRIYVYISGTRREWM